MDRQLNQLHLTASKMKLGLIYLKDSKLFNIAGKLSLNEWQGQSNEFIIDDISVNKSFKNGPIVYRLGQLVFIQQEGFDSLGPPKKHNQLQFSSPNVSNFTLNK